jgi:hypothetical protein
MEIKDLPEDIILTLFSHMESRQIVNTCLSHPRILGICESNQNFINKNILKRDYGFTQFQKNYNYTSIMVYMLNRFRIVSPQLNNPEKLMYTVIDSHLHEFNNYKEMLMYAVEPIISFDNIIVFSKFNNYNEMLTYAVQDNRIDVSRFLIENGANITDGGVASAIIHNRFDILNFFIENPQFDIKEAIKLAIIHKNINFLRYFIEELQFDITNTDDIFRTEMWFYAFVDPYLIQDVRIFDYLITRYPQLLTRNLLESISSMLQSINPDNVVVDYINLLMSSGTVESLSNFLQRPIQNLDQQYREIQSVFSEISEEEDAF